MSICSQGGLGSQRFLASDMRCLIFIDWLLNCPIWPVRLQMFVIGHVKSDSLDLKQPIKPEIRAVNNQHKKKKQLLTLLKVVDIYLAA